MTSPSPTCIVLGHDGVSLIVDLTDGRLPAVVHWGSEVGLSGDDGADLVLSGHRAGRRQSGGRTGPGGPATGALDRVGGPAGP